MLVRTIDHVARRHAERVEPGDHLRQRGARGDFGKADARLFLDRRCGAWHHHRRAARKRVGLHHERHFLNTQREIALRDGHARDAHILSHDDGARALIDHHARAALRLDQQVFHPTDGMGRRARPHPHQIEQHSARIEHQRHRLTDRAVDRLLDPPGGGEIRLSQRQPNGFQSGKIEFDLALDARARRDGTRGRHTLDDTARLTFGGGAPGDDRALRHRVDLPVGGVERRHDERATQKAPGVTNGRHGHVDLAARARERRQFRRNQHRSDVLRAKLLAGDVDAETLQDVGHQFLGKG